MVDLEDLRTDCRHFRADRPCAPHKRSGVTCAVCREDYDPIRTRILVVKLAALGDVLRTTALLPAIRAAWPQAWVSWVTAPEAVELFEGNELVDEVFSTASAVTAARLAVQEFDVVLCPDADPQAAALAAAAHAGERRGFTMDAQGRVRPLGDGARTWFMMGLDDRAKKRNTATYQELVARVLDLDPAEVGEPILVPGAADREFAARLRPERERGRPWIGLNTGAGGRWRRKSWLPAHQERFVKLAAAHGATVLLLGGPAERARHAALRDAAPAAAVVDAGNDHSVRRFAALVEMCDVVVTGDTFALHVACARRVPVVALFGPTSAAEIELYGRGEKILPEGLDCLGCYLADCAVSPHCQERILPERVWEAVERWLAGQRGGACSRR